MFDYVCVLDFEATCDDIKYYDNEIIEFPSVLLKFNGKEYEQIAEFQQFCRPLVKPIVTDFCFQLTGIPQQQVDAGHNFPDVLKAHHEWLISHIDNVEANVIILTCGFWDLGIVLVSECKKWNITPPNIYLKVLNIKNAYRDFYKKHKGTGMAAMLNELNIQLEGRHHSGIDDCRNIAKILYRMVTDGYQIIPTSITYIDKKNYFIKHPNRKKYGRCKHLMAQRLEIKNS